MNFITFLVVLTYFSPKKNEIAGNIYGMIPAHRRDRQPQNIMRAPLAPSHLRAFPDIFSSIPTRNQLITSDLISTISFGKFSDKPSPQTQNDNYMNPSQEYSHPASGQELIGREKQSQVRHESDLLLELSMLLVCHILHCFLDEPSFQRDPLLHPTLGVVVLKLCVSVCL